MVSINISYTELTKHSMNFNEFLISFVKTKSFYSYEQPSESSIKWHNSNITMHDIRSSLNNDMAKSIIIQHIECIRCIIILWRIGELYTVKHEILTNLCQVYSEWKSIKIAITFWGETIKMNFAFNA